MSPVPPLNASIDSLYAEDADYQELLAQFFRSLAEQRLTLLANFDGKQWEELARHAHQLKGAGGGYGYPGLTDAALALEKACRSEDVETIAARLQELFAYIGRILPP